MSNQLIICMPNNGFEIQMTDFILEQNLNVIFIIVQSYLNFRAQK